MINRELKIGKYRHYKGKICETIGIAKHSETLEELAVYKHNGQIWVRPLGMFLENVTKEGKTFPRFEFVGK